jgi:hypothetical protein
MLEVAASAGFSIDDDDVTSTVEDDDKVDNDLLTDRRCRFRNVAADDRPFTKQTEGYCRYTEDDDDDDDDDDDNDKETVVVVDRRKALLE